MINSNNIIKWVPFILIPIVLISVMAWKAGLPSIALLCQKADLSIILFCYSFYLLSNALKTLRFRLLIDTDRPGFINLFYLNSIYNLITATLPAGTGEISYPLLLKHKFGKSWGLGFSSVIITRLYDILFLSACFFISGIASLHLIPKQIETVILVIIIITSAFLFSLDKTVHAFSRLVHYPAEKTRLIPLLKLQALLKDVQHTLLDIKNRRIYLKIILLTLFTWFCVFLFFYYLFIALQTPVTFLQAVFIGTALNMLTLIPINTFGGFGIKEATLAGILFIIGFDQTTALSLGILARLVAFLALFVLLGFAFIIKKSV